MEDRGVEGRKSSRRLPPSRREGGRVESQDVVDGFLLRVDPPSRKRYGGQGVEGVKPRKASTVVPQSGTMVDRSNLAKGFEGQGATRPRPFTGLRRRFQQRPAQGHISIFEGGSYLALINTLL
jgi:hypothetical protein